MRRRNRGKIWRRRFLILLGGLIISSAFFVSRVFVYDTNVAHPGLTKSMVELYNSGVVETQNFASLPELTTQEIGWLMQGAIDEDYPLRWMNHFYDPIHNRGFKGAYDTAKRWAGNPQNQTNFSLGDQSWQRAIYEFQQGNKKQAFLALGHILHLLEDMTVPAHTRDDGHPSGDPYEQWVKNNFKPVSSQPVYFSVIDQYFDYLANYSNNNFYSEDTIGSRRYSRITILKDEWVEIGSGKIRKYKFAQEGQHIFRLYLSIEDFDWQSLAPTNVAIRTVRDDSVNADYFSLLAPKAVGAGAGVLKLFFEEVQKPQAQGPSWLWQTSILGYLQQPLGLLVAKLEPLWDKAKGLAGNFGSLTAKAEFITELVRSQPVLAQEAARLMGSGESALSSAPANPPPAPLAASEETAPAAVFVPNPGPAPAVAPVVLPTTPTPPPASPPSPSSSISLAEPAEDLLSDLSAGFRETPLVSAPVVQNNQPAASKSIPSTSSGSGGSSYSSSGSVSYSQIAASPSPSFSPPSRPDVGTSSAGGDSQDSPLPPPPPPPDTTPPEAPIVSEPPLALSWTASSTAVLSGSVSADSYKLFINDLEFDVSSTLWSITVGANNYLPLQEGENVFNLVAVDLAGNFSATSSVKIIKDATAPTSTVQSEIQQLSPAPQGYGAGDSTIIVSWSADDGTGSGLTSYDVEYQRQEIGSVSSTDWVSWLAATTSTQAVFAGEAGYQYTFRVRAQDQLNNSSDWVVSASQSIALPRVAINEVAWRGTKAQANDEWLELYNLEEYAVDLSQWLLSDGGDINVVFPTSTSIAAKGFFLLERTSDETIAGLAADLIYTGSLRDSGEDLSLKDGRGRLIDEVKAGNGWFAGGLGAERETMERQDPALSGNLATNWQKTPQLPRNGWDAKTNPINGTPKRPNSPFIYLDGTLTVNRVITAALNPYFLGNYTIASGTTLTIGPGVVIKAGQGGESWGGGNLFVYGVVASQGTAEAPVVFTSYRDSQYGGNTNTWDGAAAAGPGEWNRLYFYPGSRADLSQTKILYGNYRSLANDPNGALIIDSAEANLSGLTASYARAAAGNAAVNLISASTTISQSAVTDNFIGLLVSGGILNLTDSRLENNGTGLLASQSARLAIKDNVFKSNGLKQGGEGSAKITDSYLASENNQFENNSVNGLLWSGQVASDQIIDTTQDWPWLSDGLNVPLGATLKIKSGSWLKMRYNALILINGALEVEGSAEKPVVLTSWRDDSDGFNSDNSQQAPNPTAGEWYQLRFDSPAASVLNYLTVRYANQRSWADDPAGSVYVKQTPFSADHLRIEYSRVPDVALQLKDASQAVVTNAAMKNETKLSFDPWSCCTNGTGILIDAGAPIISDTILDTFNYGLRRRNQPQEQLTNVNFVNVDVPIGN